jgi:hypothetical protein
MSDAFKDIEFACRTTPVSPDCEEWSFAPACRMPDEGDAHLVCTDGSSFDPCVARFSGDFFSIADGALEYALIQYSSMHFIERLECASRRFEGTPFAADPLGEGDAGLVDADPLFSFESLDCMTYVEQVLALASGAQDFSGFLGELLDIRYVGGLSTYGARKHFVSADWVPENAASGRIEDVTARVGGDATRRISIAIDRSRWVGERTDLSRPQKEAASFDLLEIGKIGLREVALDYIPSSAFLGKVDGDVHNTMIDALPEVSIVLFVRHQKAASDLGIIVGHMGFLLTPKRADGSRGEPILRHSSSKYGAVIEEPFLPYLDSQQKYRAGVTVLDILEKPAFSRSRHIKTAAR